MIGLLVSTACSRDLDSSDAQKIFETHQATIDTIEGEIRAAIKDRPQLAGPETSHHDAIQTLRSTVLPRLLEAHHQVTGVGLHYRNATMKQSRFLGEIGLLPGGYGQRVEPKHGINLASKQLGWGRYQTSYQHGSAPIQGDGKMRPGIEVAWSVTESGIDLEIALTLLSDYETTAEWRAGLR